MKKLLAEGPIDVRELEDILVFMEYGDLDKLVEEAQELDGDIIVQIWHQPLGGK